MTLLSFPVEALSLRSKDLSSGKSMESGLEQVRGRVSSFRRRCEYVSI